MYDMGKPKQYVRKPKQYIEISKYYVEKSMYYAGKRTYDAAETESDAPTAISFSNKNNLWTVRHKTCNRLSAS